MKKNKKLLTALAVMTLITTASLAAFTDRADGNFTGDAATLSLSAVTNNSENLKAIAPGQTRKLDVKTTYSGTVAGKARLVIEDKGTGTGAIQAPTAKEGFVLKHNDKAVTMTGKKYVIDLGKVTNGKVLTTPLALELLFDTENAYQNAQVKLSYSFEVMQDHGTTWAKVDDKSIVIKAK